MLAGFCFQGVGFISESRERMASIHSTEMGELEADLKSQFSQMIVQLQADHESLTDDYHQLQG